jgi:hypothetical protein
MYINAVANIVMLCLQHDFYNIIFKMKRKLYIASGSAPPTRNPGCAPVTQRRVVTLYRRFGTTYGSHLQR